MLRASVLLLVALTIGTVAGDEGDRAELVEGVHALGAQTHPGSVVAFGPEAFVVVADERGVPVVAAARIRASGQRGGRVLALGHGGYLGAESLAAADTAELVQNAVRWLAGGRRRPALACAGDAKLAEALAGIGLRAEVELPLAKTDVLVLREGELSRARIGELAAWIEAGGGLLVAATGWGWQQLNPSRSLARDLPPNRLLARFGIAFGAEIARVDAEARLLVAGPPPELAHAGCALERWRAGTVDDPALAGERLAAALAALPDDEPTLVLPLRRALAVGELAGEDPLAQRVRAASAAREWRPLSPRFGEWWVLGPLKAGRVFADSGLLDGERERFAAGGPGPDLARRVRDARWRRIEVESDGRALDVGPLRLERVFPEESARVRQAWLWRSIELEEPARLAFALGVDRRARAWIDGALVLERDASPGMELARDEVAVDLEAGAHNLLVQLESDAPIWALRMTPAGSGEPSQRAIEAAIERGVDWLLERQHLDGSWDAFGEYGPGYTALVAYVLMRCGLAPEDPDVRAALAYVRALPAEHTYSLGPRMLALAAADRGAGKEELARDAERMLAWQESDGLWSYPLYPDGTDRPVDLSTTLYAVLALRAAASRGVAIPQAAWLAAIDGCWRVREGGAPRERTRAGGEGVEPAGFAYRVNERPTGSMTTAGLTVIAIASEAMGQELDHKRTLQCELATRAGLAWLDRHATWSENPGNPRFQYFFLYGIERVGSLLGLDVLGRSRWYAAGAEYLLAHQAPDGSWKDDFDRKEAQETPLALLFLARSSAPPSGRSSISTRVSSAGGPLLVHAIGRGPVDVWLEGLAPAARERLGAQALVEKVTWSARRDGRERVLAEVARDPRRPDGAQRFEARLDPGMEGGAGSVEIFALASVRTPAASGVGFERTDLESEALLVELESHEPDARLGYARDHARNLLAREDTLFEASSSVPGEVPALAADRSHATRWRATAVDAAPWWRATLAGPVTADRVLVAHAFTRPMDAELLRASAVEVVLDGRERRVFELDPDQGAKSELLLGEPRKLSRVELRILGTTKPPSGTAGAGFSEVQLVLGR